MKITKFTRFLLVALAAMMVFSLFACGETPKENETTTEENKTPVESTGEKDPDVTESDPTVDTESSDVAGGDATEPKDTETTEVKTPETTESETVTQTEPACQHAELETLAAVAPTCEETGLTEGKKCVACGTVTVAQETVAALGHAYEGKVTTEPTCEDKGVKTYTCANDASHTYTEEIAANGHDKQRVEATTAGCTTAGYKAYDKCSVCQKMWNLEGAEITAPEEVPAGHDVKAVEAKPATCTEDGYEAHYECKNCGEFFSDAEGKTKIEKPVIAAKGHTEVTDAAKAPTCEATGLTEGKHCSVCNEVLKAQDTVAALGHAWNEGEITTTPTCVAKGVKTFTCQNDASHTKTEEVEIDPNNHVGEAYIAVSTLEKKCGSCNAIIEKYPAEIFGANGFDAFFGPAVLSNNTAVTQGVLSEDGQSTKFYGNGKQTEGFINLLLNDNNDKALGQYLVIKYKIDFDDSNYFGVQIYASTTETDATKASEKSINYTKDGEWHVMVFDLATIKGYTANADGEYIPKLIRLDIINPHDASKSLSAEDCVELGYVAIFDDPADCIAYMASNEADKAICQHNVKYVSPTCEQSCACCGKEYGIGHNVTETITESGNVRTTVGICDNCKAEIYKYETVFGDKKPLYFASATDVMAQANKGSNLGGAVLSADGTYVSVYNKVDQGDGYFHLIPPDTETGRYIMVKYRNNFGDGFEWYCMTQGNNHKNFYTSPKSSGQWTTVILDLASIIPDNYTANADGKYIANWIRWDLHNAKKSDSVVVDIAYAAASDNIEDLIAINGAESYVLYTASSGYHGPQSPETGNIYFDHNFVNGIHFGGNKNEILVDYESSNGITFSRIYCKNASEEERYNFWGDVSLRATVGSGNGNYIAFLYRKPVGSPSDSADIFLSSNLGGPKGNGDSNSVGKYVADNYWHLMIVDLTDNMDKNKPAYYDPELGISCLAIDWFNAGGRVAGETYVDVAFVAMFDSIEDANDYFKGYVKKYEISCKHDSVTHTYAGDEDENTSYALANITCNICGYTWVGKAPQINNVGSISGHFSNVNSGAYSDPYVFGPDNSRYPTEGYMTPNSDKTVGMSGWGGAVGKITKTAYRVLDAEGKVVIEWTVYNNVDLNPGDIDGIKSGVAGILPDYGSAFRFSIAADLSSLYVADNYGKMFTVEFAYIADDAIGNDKYLVCGIFENVMIPQPVCEHTELETLAAVAPTCEATGLTEGKKCVACGTVTVAQNTVAALGHAWDNGKVTTEPTCEGKGVKTYTCANDATHTKTEDIDATGHTPVVDAAVAPTCEATGLTEGKHCSVCNEVLKAQEPVAALGHAWDNGKVTTEPTCEGKGTKTYTCANDATHTKTEEIDATGHTPVVDAAVAPTCEATGLTEGKHCSVCNEVLKAQEPVAPKGHAYNDGVVTTKPTCEGKGVKTYTCANDATHTKTEEITATGHTQKDVAYAAPTTAEEGWAAHKACAKCDMVWDTEGNEIEAVPTIAKIVPTTEKYWGAYELSKMSVSSSVGSTFKPTAMSADRLFVRFERDGTESRDGALYLVDNKDSTVVTGQYLIFKYRTDHVTQVELFATTEGGTNGNAHIYPSMVNDGKWHLVIINLADQLNAYVKPEDDGSYVLTWSRIDIFDQEANKGYFDIAWIVTCDDPAEVNSILQDGDTELCYHISAVDPTYTNNGDSHSTACAICGEALTARHGMTGLPTWDANERKYVGECICGATLEQNVLYISEAASVSSACSSFVPEQMGGFVRYTKKGSADPYAHIYLNGSVVTGQYAIVKYRVSKAGLTYSNSFVGSIMGDHATASSGCDSNIGAYANGSFVYTKGGEWQYVVIELKSTCFKPNADGSYSCRFLRLGLGSFADGDYIEVDEIAFVDNTYAAQRYIHGDAAVCPYSHANYKWNNDTYAYEITCAYCGNTTSNAIYKTEGSLGSYSSDLGYNVAGSSENYLAATREDGFVRYTPKKSAGDPFFNPFIGNTTNVTGQYMIIKYRAVNNGVNMSTSALYASTQAHGQANAAGGNGSNQNNALYTSTIYADGEWHYLVIAADLEKNETFLPNEGGTYTWKYIRMRLNNFQAFDGSCYFDIDEIMFVDNKEAVEAIYYKENPDYRMCIDHGANQNTGINGEKVAIPMEKQVMDLESFGLINPTKGVAIGGWFVTPGGVASYQYRVIKVDGVAVENPEFIGSGWTGGTAYASQGDKNWLDTCGKGAGWQSPHWFTLTDYDGKKVDVEVVAITNYGAEIVFLTIKNINVAPLHNGPATTPFYVDGESVQSLTTETGGVLSANTVRFTGNLSSVAVYCNSTIKVANGWHTTDGGWARFVYRVTEGENVYIVVPGEPLSSDDGVRKDGVSHGFDDKCAINGSYNKGLSFSLADVKDAEGNAVDLTGKTIKVELVGQTNNGDDIVIARYTNITVQAAPAT